MSPEQRLIRCTSLLLLVMVGLDLSGRYSGNHEGVELVASREEEAQARVVMMNCRSRANGVAVASCWLR